MIAVSKKVYLISLLLMSDEERATVSAWPKRGTMRGETFLVHQRDALRFKSLMRDRLEQQGIDVPVMAMNASKLHLTREGMALHASRAIKHYVCKKARV